MSAANGLGSFVEDSSPLEFPLPTSRNKPDNLSELFGVPKSTVSKLLNEELCYAVVIKGIRISGPILKNTAEELAQKLGRQDFVATDGWLSRLLKAHDKFKRAHSEMGSAGTGGAEECCLLFYLSSCASISPTIFAMRTRRVVLPSNSRWIILLRLPTAQWFKEGYGRLTILCCASMTGNDKVKLLVIGKSKKPRCFKGLDVDIGATGF